MPAEANSSDLSARDLEQLAARGIPAAEARRQLEQLRRPPPALDLVRPCTVGDGIQRLTAAERVELERRHAETAAGGRLCAFVPASGAASRMFHELLACRSQPRAWTRAELEAEAAAGGAEASALEAFVSGLDGFAFRDDLARAVSARGARLEALLPSGPYRPLLEALLDRDGLDYGSIPKGLIPFHVFEGTPRTAFEEHLAEASVLVGDTSGRVRLHATVSQDHAAGFAAALDRARARDASASLTYDVDFSLQDPTTDTLACDDAGAPFRDALGALVLRPAGHGALLGNLSRAPAPVAMIKNIDNVAAAAHRGPTLEWTRAVVGRLGELKTQADALARRLADPADAAAPVEAGAWLSEHGWDEGGGATAPDRGALRAMLDRPLRVCGMVPNTGEPGGAPFWVRGRDGRVSRQIVESAQLADDAGQRAIFRAATHFNPVFMACALDDAAGQRHDLSRHVDPEAVVVTRRSARGRELLALERPGLWNGGMAGWNTVFVEVPLAVFNPVKSVLDLLRPEHQGR